MLNKDRIAKACCKAVVKQLEADGIEIKPRDRDTFRQAVRLLILGFLTDY